MRTILETYNTAELKKFISRTNIKGYSKLKKEELIKLMTRAEHLSKFRNIRPKKKQPPLRKAKVQVKEVKRQPAPNLKIDVPPRPAQTLPKPRTDLFPVNPKVKEQQFYIAKFIENNDKASQASPARAPSYDDPDPFDFLYQNAMIELADVPEDDDPFGEKEDEQRMKAGLPPIHNIYGEDNLLDKWNAQQKEKELDELIDQKYEDHKFAKQFNIPTISVSDYVEVKVPKGKPPIPQNNFVAIKEKKEKVGDTPKTPSLPSTASGKKKRKGFAPKIVARSARGKARSQAEARRVEEVKKKRLEEKRLEELKEKEKPQLEPDRSGGGQLHPDFRRDRARQGYTDFASSAQFDEAYIDFDEPDEDHPDYRPKPKHDYSQYTTKEGRKAPQVNPFGSQNKVRIRKREEKQPEGGGLTKTQEANLPEALKKAILRKQAIARGEKVEDDKSVGGYFTKKAKQEFADRFIEQAKAVSPKMSKEWMKRYLAEYVLDNPSKTFDSKSQAFSKVAEEMFKDADKEFKTREAGAKTGKEVKYKKELAELTSKFNEQISKLEAKIKDPKTKLGEKNKAKKALEQKKERKKISIEKLKSKYGK